MIDEETGEIIASTYRRSGSLAELFAALGKAQSKFKTAPKDASNPHFRSKYPTLESVIEATQDALAENDLCVLQMPVNIGTDIGVTTILGHASGESIESTLRVAPVKFDAQGVGSVITYLRRYARLSILGIAPEDDDGEAAVARPTAVPLGATKATPAVRPRRDPQSPTEPAERMSRQETAETPSRTSPASAARIKALGEIGYEAASRGTAPLEAWWAGLSREDKVLMSGSGQHLKPVAEAADRTPHESEANSGAAP